MSRRSTVEDWRRAVFRASYLSGNVQVLLLVLADHMRADRKVSVPRQQLAAELNVAPQRVAERIAGAIDKGWLSKVGGGYRGRTAEFEGLFGNEQKGSGTLGRNPSRIPGPFPKRSSRSEAPESIRDSKDATTRAEPSRHLENATCHWHEFDACPADCANYVTDAKRSSA